MKKILLTIALISVFLVPALQAQGGTIRGVVPDPDGGKVRVWGSVHFTHNQAAKISYSISANLHLLRHGAPITGAIVRVQGTQLDDEGDGNYRKFILTTKFGLGDIVKLDVELPRVFPLRTVDPLYSGLVKMAEYRIGNTIEWIFPIHNQVIDLSAYPTGIPVRWDFTGTPGRVHLIVNIVGALIFTTEVSGERTTIPAGILRPGTGYNFLMIDENHNFTVNSSFSPRSSISFTMDSIILAFTQSAK